MRCAFILKQANMSEQTTSQTTSQIEVVKQPTKPKKSKTKKKKKLVLVSPTANKEPNIKNRGTGAGGSKTNKNGLSYEEATSLDDRITIVEKNRFSNIIRFADSKKLYTKTKQADLFKDMKDEINTDIEKGHGCKNPDECYIDKDLKNLFIIEKKFQQCPGSVCEKIQTPDFKLWQYSRTFPDYAIIYVFCLSDWFKKNCIAELEYLDFKNIPYFWGSSETYKDDIITFILNYE